MCGRYTLSTATEDVARVFEVPDYQPLRPRYNVAPSQLVAVIGLKPDGLTRGMIQVRWGFVPNWASDPTSGPKPINAKSETIHWKSPFADSFRQKRCLIPANGFFEWGVEGKRKVAHHFRMRGGGPFAFAGIWDLWRAEGHTPLLSCAIITVAANELVKPFHERMPAILRPEHYTPWLASDTSQAELLGMLAPFPVELMEVVRVGQAVNKVANDGPECLEAAA